MPSPALTHFRPTHPPPIFRFDPRPYLYKLIAPHISSIKYAKREDGEQELYKEGGVLAAYGKYKVLGTPFKEDLIATQYFPARRLRVQVQGQDAILPSNECLYELFRPYGRLFTINRTSPTAAVIAYTSIRSAVNAKVCTHGMKLKKGPTENKIEVVYEVINSGKHIGTWLTDHPRLMIPLLVALGVGISIAIFDPIRVFFIKNTLMSRLSGLPFRASLSRLGLVAPAVTHQSHPEAENLKEILTQPPEQFICISGPSGSGKGDLLNAATADIKAKLEIDFTALFKHHDTAGDTSVHLAKQVGYFPYFSGWRQLSSLADAASVGLTGVKAGLSSSEESQVVHILECVTIALTKLRSEANHLADDENDSPHPVIIINKYMDAGKAVDGQEKIIDAIEKWATLVLDNKLAHIIWITQSSSSAKYISRLAPSKSVHNITLSDLPYTTARKIMVDRIGEAKIASLGTEQEIEGSITQLGGRLGELTSLIQKLKTTNLTLSAAVQEVVQKNLTEFRKTAFDTTKWTLPQMWEVVTLFANEDEIPIDRVLYRDLFKGDIKSLQEMERSELIQIVYEADQPRLVKPFKRIYLHAIRLLLADKTYCASMYYKYHLQLLKTETEKLQNYQADLKQLRELSHGNWTVSGWIWGTREKNRKPSEIVEREHFLLDRIGSCNAKIKKHYAHVNNYGDEAQRMPYHRTA